MSTEEIKKILGIDENNIFINWPEEMGVKGKNNRKFYEKDIRLFLTTFSCDISYDMV